MRFDVLTGVRGLAAFIVFVSHAANHGYLPSFIGAGYGQVGVMIFFVLSGFLMSYLYGDRAWTHESSKSYFLSRLSRVAPLYLTVVIVFFVLGEFGIDTSLSITGVESLFAHALFIKADGILWTVPIEVQFYVLFFCMWGVVKHWGIPDIPVYIVVSVVSLLLGVLLYLVKGEFVHILPYYVVHFSLGCVMGSLIRQEKIRLDFLPRLAKASLWGMCIFFLVFLPPGLRSLLGIDYVDNAYLQTWFHPFSVFSALLLILLAVKGMDVKGLFCSKPVQFMGDISYGFYLLQMPVYFLAKSVIDEVAGFVFLLVWFLATVGVSYLSLLYFERPIQNIIRKMA